MATVVSHNENAAKPLDGTTLSLEPDMGRVLCYNHTGLASGAERILLQTMAALEREGFAVTLAAPEGRLGEMAREQGVATLPIAPLQARFTSHPVALLRHLGSLASTVLAFRRTVRLQAPAVLHANSVRAGIVATLATAGSSTPIVWHVQDDLPQHLISSGIRRLVLASKRVSLIAVSHATARAFQGPYDMQDRLTVIHNGVDLSRYPGKQVAPSSLREEIGLPQDAFLLCAVGMINKRKGLAGLITAMHRVVAQRKDVFLAIAGAPTFNRDDLHLAELQAQVESLGLQEHVLFLGARKDVPAVLRAADLLVLNALVEPFGLVLVEAMASGTPVLGTRVGGIPEIITDGENGFLVEPGKPDELADRINTIIADGAARERVATKAQQETCPQFSLERFQAEMAAYYRKHFSKTGKRA